MELILVTITFILERVMISRNDLGFIYVLGNVLSFLTCITLQLFWIIRKKQLTMRKNPFTYLIMLDILFLFIARPILIWIEPSLSFLDINNLFFIGFPLIILGSYILTNEKFVWFYFFYSVIIVAYYSLNALLPQMSINMNLFVIQKTILISTLYALYLYVFFKEEFIESRKRFAFWLFDFDKKDAFWGLFPLIALMLIALVTLLSILIKFNKVIFRVFI